MIERLLVAGAALDRGDLDLAERVFAQVADVDPRNAIAVVGLARIAARRGDAEAARAFAGRALEIDPDEAAARRLLLELEAGAVPEPAAPTVSASGREAVGASGRDRARRPSLVDRIRRWLGRSRAPR